ncbi:hypothetical protein KFL_000690240 [Klebsormidium nitens]|uniref:FHA domain-containing protein n=1 Tax=Klebsormidium nitens TaxID=105231 RepID=A0A1Y1HX11_KLENI|nr:hypothetical protein KFL_000690240 [Klebsormidium nitens]|eukprot:GAQ81046.1 hypothetical protein KFL_000690240 [Klebsormidium nitens]
MVWQLSSTPTNPAPVPITYHFTAPGEYKVGRKDCTVTINTDKTVSRLHADIIVGPSPTVLSPEGAIPRPFIKIKDLSKFGTFINKQHESHPIKDLPDAEAHLKDGDIVTFGSTHCSFRLTFIPLVLCLPCGLSTSKAQIVERAAKQIGAFLVDTWSPQCTHLLAEDGTALSPLFYEAVGAGKPVVTLEWIQAFAARETPSKPVPDPSSFLPTFTVARARAPPASHQVALPEARRGLLSGFVVLLAATAPYDPHLRDMISAAGGQLEETALPSEKKHRQRLYVKASKAAAGDEDPADAEKCQQATEQKLMLAILTGQLALADVTVPQPAASEGSKGTDVTTDDEMAEAGEEVAGPSTAPGDGWNSTPHIRTSQAQKPPPRPPVVLPPRRSVATPSTPAESPSRATQANGATPAGDREGSGADSKAEILFEPGLVKVDLNRPQPVYGIGASSQWDGTGPNFKRFRKVLPIGGAGNSFETLIPYAKEPYKESNEFRNREVEDFVREEKAKTVAAAAADDLFNAEKIRRQKAAAKAAPRRDDSDMPPPKPRAPAKRKR